MEQLVAALSERFTETRVLGPDETAERLATRSLATEYASLLGDFDRAGVVDPTRLEALLTGLGATHFLHVQAGYEGEWLERTATYLDGSPFVYDTKRQDLYAVARLWDASRGTPAWEGLVSVGSQAGPLTVDRDPAELVESLVLSLAESLPIARPATAEAGREGPGGG